MAPFASPRMASTALQWAVGICALLTLVLAGTTSVDSLRFSLLAVVVLGVLLTTQKRQAMEHLTVAELLAAITLLGFSFWRARAQGDAIWFAVMPLPLGIGLMILEGGFAGIAMRWRELLVLVFLALAPFAETILLELLALELAPATARFTAALLRLAGWSASANDVLVTLPATSLVVSQGCSGLKSISFLTLVAFATLAIYPLPGRLRKGLAIVAAGVIGFLVNAIRVAILALLAGPGHEAAFAFWHIQQGAIVFEFLAVGVFIALIYLLIPPARATPPSR